MEQHKNQQNAETFPSETANVPDAAAAAGLIEKQQDIVNRIESGQFNKTNMQFLKHALVMCEKMKVPYYIGVTALPCDEKKTNRKPKKITSSNKYILFNTFVSKIKQPGWPSSYSLWNDTKSDSRNEKFLQIFNHVEDLIKKIVITKSVNNGSSIEPQQQQHQSKKSNLTKNGATIVDDVEESNRKRNEYYHEFISVLKHVYEKGRAPSNSLVYDSKLTKSLLERAVADFKSFITMKLTDVTATVATTVTIASQSPSPSENRSGKRRNVTDEKSNTTTTTQSSPPHPLLPPLAKKQRQAKKTAVKKLIQMKSPIYCNNMTSDSVYDSNMSD
ncbi:PP31 [Spodoptera littoralis nucleopolyhedrovirus]|uniref:PP31 n=1 Tax=Spodoptera littoralis nuclear polyhedrosis virus TaxID=10456 RepID=M1J450_NPVSL|nr:PP31 [Spodoptera littoralis nucleopolyhedrovirus]AGE89884.1 PP31 [Spodoptera littoralis nucleopolyhedrovirus]AYU75222.1 PP31 early 39 kDa protein [Spodoptera littoralis nucleopolyhedrovirus]